MIIVLNRQTGEETRIKGPKTVHNLLKELDLLEGSVLVARNNELLTRDVQLKDGETVELIPVVSGG